MSWICPVCKEVLNDEECHTNCYTPK